MPSTRGGRFTSGGNRSSIGFTAHWPMGSMALARVARAVTATTSRPSRNQAVQSSTVPMSSSVRSRLAGSATSQNSLERRR